MTVTSQGVPARPRRRLTWTAAIVLISLGGAGLATTADRPAGDATRPELTAHSDKLAAAWLEAMTSQAHAVADRVEAVSQTGRQVLGQLDSLDPAEIGDALAEGDQASSALESAGTALTDLRVQGPPGLDETRLSQHNRRLLTALDELLGAAITMPNTWRAIVAATRQVSQLLVALISHDEFVFQATSAGRQADWADALSLLVDAGGTLDQAHAVRDTLATTSDVSTLDDLLARYAAYDEALTALYSALRDGAGVDSRQVKALENAVAIAEARLPADASALKIVVADASGGAVADGVVSLEEARGTVDQAVAALP